MNVFYPFSFSTFAGVDRRSLAGKDDFAERKGRGRLLCAFFRDEFFFSSSRAAAESTFARELVLRQAAGIIALLPTRRRRRDMQKPRGAILFPPVAHSHLHWL